MKLEPNMYVRTKGGEIHKITNIIPFYENDELIYEQQYLYLDNNNIGFKIWLFQDYILKASHNIIDLIEVGDYVNGKRVGFINDSDYYKDIFLSEDYEEPYKTIIVKNYKDIKSILTKEMYSSVEYKVGE